MSEKFDQFAQDLLEKTRSNKLRWTRALSLYDQFSVELGEGFVFSIQREQSGDNIQIVLRLKVRDKEEITSVQVRNWPLTKEGTTDRNAVIRFRLYSDLFDAARESSVNVDETFDKVEELLRKIG